jgi:hypothetical protein
MLISLRKLLQQQTDSVRIRILDLNALDGAGFQKNGQESDGTLKRKNPPEGRFFKASKELKSALWNARWCPKPESNRHVLTNGGF